MSDILAQPAASVLPAFPQEVLRAGAAGLAGGAQALDALAPAERQTYLEDAAAALSGAWPVLSALTDAARPPSNAVAAMIDRLLQPLKPADNDALVPLLQAVLPTTGLVNRWTFLQAEQAVRSINRTPGLMRVVRYGFNADPEPGAPKSHRGFAVVEDAVRDLHSATAPNPAQAILVAGLRALSAVSSRAA